MSYHNYEMKIGDLKDQIAELEKDNKEMKELIRSYCCCNSMGSTEGQCCFCDDLEELESK